MTSLILALALVSPSLAGPIGVEDPHAAPPTGFPGAFVSAVSVSLAADKDYGDRFLDAVLAEMRTVCAMTSPEALSDSLEATIGGDEGLEAFRDTLGREPLIPSRAAAVFLAHALARPIQFRELLVRLETLQPGLERYSARLLQRAKGAGDPRLLAAVRDAGNDSPNPEKAGYPLSLRLAHFFDSFDSPPDASSSASTRGLDRTRPR